MADYISREVAIRELLSEPTDAHYPSWYAEMLKQIPAADVQPVVRSEWGLDPQCPVCGEDRYKGLEADIWAGWEPPFCPNCGANMRPRHAGCRLQDL